MWVRLYWPLCSSRLIKQHLSYRARLCSSTELIFLRYRFIHFEFLLRYLQFWALCTVALRHIGWRFFFLFRVSLVTLNQDLRLTIVYQRNLLLRVVQGHLRTLNYVEMVIIDELRLRVGVLCYRTRREYRGRSRNDLREDVSYVSLASALLQLLNS